MRVVLQRVSRASVTAEGEVAGAIGRGWLALVGVGPSDTEATAATMSDKLASLRVFEDEQGKMNLSAADVGAAFLLVSQFTLYADLSRGRRPSFLGAAAPTIAAPLVDHLAALLRGRGFMVETGRFGAHMAVELVNDGPVTIVLSSDDWPTHI